nr:MAG TPA: hypothetical protein [Caudoviricetes sp.]DAR02490.1 MAG TPA: hypothetical protein [Caudoviricetes sp.]
MKEYNADPKRVSIGRYIISFCRNEHFSIAFNII